MEDTPTTQPPLLRRLSDASRSFLLLGALLYFFGFLTISAYLARFGIASFDIINARFMIAGILTIVPLMFVFWVAWQFAQLFPAKSFFRSHNRSQRCWFLWLLPTTASFAGIGFSGLFKLGSYTAPISPNDMNYHPLGRWDIIGTHLPVNALAWIPGPPFVVRYLALAILYVVPAVVLVYAGVTTIRRARSSRPKNFLPSTPAPSTQPEATSTTVPTPVDAPPGPAASTAVDAATTTPAVATSPTLTPGDARAGNGGSGRISMHWDWIPELLLLLYMAMQLIYAYGQIAVTLIDFGTINDSALDSRVMGHWLLLSITGVYIVLTAYDVPTKGLIKSFSESFGHPHATVSAVNVVLVPLLSSILLFGSAVFPRISYTIGGGQPRAIILPEGNPLEVTASARAFLLGESSQHYFLVVLRDSSARAAQISKTALPIIITRSSGLSLNIGGADSSRVLSHNDSLSTPSAPSSRAKASRP